MRLHPPSRPGTDTIRYVHLPLAFYPSIRLKIHAARLVLADVITSALGAEVILALYSSVSAWVFIPAVVFVCARINKRGGRTSVAYPRAKKSEGTTPTNMNVRYAVLGFHLKYL